MNTGMKKAAIAAGALAAAGLFGSLPYNGSSVAQSDAPVQHHEIALVDVASDTSLLADEGKLANAFLGDVFGTNGTEAAQYSDLAKSIGTADANQLLDTSSTAAPIFTSIFDGAETKAFDALSVDGLLLTEQLNNYLGVSETDSQTMMYDVLTGSGGPGIPSDVNLTDTDLSGAIGSSQFDTDLMQIANADFASAVTDGEAYLTSLSGDLPLAGDFELLLGDIGGSFYGFTNLIGGVSSVLSDVLGSGGLSSILGDLGGSGGLSSILGDLGSGSLSGILGDLGSGGLSSLLGDLGNLL